MTSAIATAIADNAANAGCVLLLARMRPTIAPGATGGVSSAVLELSCRCDRQLRGVPSICPGARRGPSGGRRPVPPTCRRPDRRPCRQAVRCQTCGTTGESARDDDGSTVIVAVWPEGDRAQADVLPDLRTAVRNDPDVGGRGPIRAASRWPDVPPADRAASTRCSGSTTHPDWRAARGSGLPPGPSKARTRRHQDRDRQTFAAQHARGLPAADHRYARTTHGEIVAAQRATIDAGQPDSPRAHAPRRCDSTQGQ